MPKQYNNNDKENHLQIRALIHLRGFHYSSCQVIFSKAENRLSKTKNADFSML